MTDRSTIYKLKLPKIESGSSQSKLTRVNTVDDNGSDEFNLPKLPILPVKKKKEQSEGIKEYICKKRELFMIQFNLNQKEKEVQELSTFIIKEELDLQQAENNLELEGNVFEEFIEESKKLAIEANEKAEKTRKSKMEKNQELKQLQSQINHLKHEIAKFEDSLKELETYELFITRLTSKPAEEKSDPISKTKEEYLLDPKELLDVYQSLRKRIINQMTHLVHEEQIADQVKEYTDWLHTTVGKAIADLESERLTLVTTLEKVNDKETETAKLLTCLKEQMSSEQFLTEAREVEQMNKKIKEVYESCLRENEAKLEPLHLLAQIEVLFVDLLITIDTIPQDKVHELQKLRIQQRDEISRRSRLLATKTKGGCQKCEDRYKRKQTKP